MHGRDSGLPQGRGNGRSSEGDSESRLWVAVARRGQGKPEWRTPKERLGWSVSKVGPRSEGVAVGSSRIRATKHRPKRSARQFCVT
jgi:hypothetical protein